MSIDVKEVRTKETTMMQANALKDSQSIDHRNSTKKPSAKSMKRLRQILLTAAVGGAMISAPQMVEAAPHTLSGAQTVTQTINDDDATVTTTSDFSVNATSGHAVSITGAGSISYDDGDYNNVLATSGMGGDGLYIESAGDIASGNDGSVTVNSGGSITGFRRGITARNSGSGDISITVDGDVSATGNDSFSDGISAANDVDGNDITVIANNSNTISGTKTGIHVYNRGSGDTIVATNGSVIGHEIVGISIENNASATGVMEVTANDVEGNSYGIRAINRSTGDVSVTSTGTVTGTTDSGIEVLNQHTSAMSNVIVEANNVNGGKHGINVENLGGGSISITADGDITGDTDNDGEGSGIHAINDNTLAGDLTVTANNNVSGGEDGIYAQNAGLGKTSVKVTSGTVEGDADDGIFIENTNSANTEMLSVVTGGGGVTVNVIGGRHGINANNAGTGTVQIYNFGTVTGITGDGIHAIANAGINQTLSITGSNITGNQYGVFAQNDGVGPTTITTLGTVEGTNEAGIHVENTIKSTDDVTVTANTVTGGTHGIWVDNYGASSSIVNASGPVEGATGSGIVVYNTAATSEDITISASNTVTGNNYGIYANNSGAGDISITADGDVESLANGSGIYAMNAGSGDISVTTHGTVTGSINDGMNIRNLNTDAGDINIIANGNVAGAQRGIRVTYRGAGNTNITTKGIVQGGVSGIYVDAGSISDPLQSVFINVEDGSTIQNNSGDSAHRAIQVDGRAGSTATIVNDGVINGYIVTKAGADTFANNNVWVAAGGTTDFGDGNDLFNNTGTLRAANSSGTSTAFTRVQGIEIVNNSGDIVMQNQMLGNANAVVGDNITFTSGDGGFNTNGGTFNTNGGTLYVDTDFSTGLSDILVVDNAAGGTMGVDVNIVNGLGQATTGDGVMIVDVVGDGYGAGTSSPDAFALTSPLTAGLFAYDLNQGQGSPSWFLQSEVRAEAVAAGVLPVLGSRTALSTLSNLHDRQRDIKVLSDNANSMKGVWGRVFGQSNDFRANDSNDFGFDTNLWGVQAGLDVKASDDGAGNRKYAGLYVAYATSSGNARQYDAKVADLDLNATTLGAYYTKYSASNWYLDLVAQYSRLGGVKAKTATDEIKPSGNSYALSLEAGKQFNPDGNIIREIQAQLINQYTDVDDVTLNGGDELKLSSVNAVTGRFGVRLYGNPTSGKSFLPWLRANIWHTFSGDSTISSLGSSISTPIGGTSGELELGFSKGNAQSGGWGFYGSAGYLFDISGAEYSGWKGTLGLRKGW